MIPPTSDPAARVRELERLCKEMAEAHRALLNMPAGIHALRCLDRGIGTGTSMEAWLQARAALKRYKEAKL